MQYLFLATIYVNIQSDTGGLFCIENKGVLLTILRYLIYPEL